MYTPALLFKCRRPGPATSSASMCPWWCLSRARGLKWRSSPPNDLCPALGWAGQGRAGQGWDWLGWNGSLLSLRNSQPRIHIAIYGTAGPGGWGAGLGMQDSQVMVMGLHPRRWVLRFNHGVGGGEG